MQVLFTGLLTFGVPLLVGGDHVAQGKEQLNHDGHLRYSAPHPYEEGTCGQPLWAVVTPGSSVPDAALLAGHDSQVCDGTVCGKDIYVSMVSVGGGAALGKTWFKRTDGHCASLAFEGEGIAASTDGSCRVLTMGSAAHLRVRFNWEAVEAFGNGPNRFTAPKRALVAGNHPENHGPLYVCRFVDDKGDHLVGQTWFPRHDEACCSAEYGGGVVTSAHCEVLTKEPC